MDAVRVRVAGRNLDQPLGLANARWYVESLLAKGIDAAVIEAPPDVVAHAVAEARRGITDAGLAAAHAVERKRRADECFDALERACETDSEER